MTITNPSTAPIAAIYDRYADLLYSFALQTCRTQAAAEQVLVLTFQKIDASHLSQPNHTLYVALLKLLLRTARAIENGQLLRTDAHTRPFALTPMLNDLIFDNSDLASFCQKKQLTRMQLGQQLRAEFQLLRAV